MAQCSFFFFFFLSVLELGELKIFPPWRFDLNISSARTDQLVFTLYADVGLCRKPLLAKLRHMNGMCVCFCSEGPICIHMNISIYIFFKAFLYVSKLLFNVCVSWKICCCMCALQAYS